MNIINLNLIYKVGILHNNDVVEVCAAFFLQCEAREYCNRLRSYNYNAILLDYKNNIIKSC